MRIHYTLPIAVLLLIPEHTIAQGGGASCGQRIQAFGQEGVQFVDVSTYNLAGRSDYCEDIVQQTSGRIILGGWYRTGGGGDNWNWALTGLSEEGMLDSTFGLNGKVRLNSTTLDLNSRAYALAVESQSQKIYAAGAARIDDSEPHSMTALRFHENGNIDSTFGDNGRMFDIRLGSSSAQDIAVHHDGGLLMVGRAFDAAICSKYLPNGDPDPTFGNDALPGLARLPGVGNFNALVVDPMDSSIVAVGKGFIDVIVARFTKEGQLDPSFAGTGWAVYDPDSFGYASDARAVALDEYGRIILTGTARSGANSLIMRLNRNGSADPNFGVGGTVIMNPTSSVSETNAVLVQSDCRIVVAGATNTFSTQVRPHMLLRFNPDGQLDDTFGEGGIMIDEYPVGANFNGTWNAVLLSRAGTLLLGGTGHDQSGTFPDFCVAEYQTCIDASTDCLLGPNSVESFEELTADRIRLHPNPAVTTVSITVTSGTAISGIGIYDAVGRIAAPLLATKREGTVVLPIQTLLPGVYTLRIDMIDGTKALTRLVKE